jgi:TetR/AcrR family transcriptional regulator, regulator of cefoperazone and chloramphenicol sensitivity
MTEPTRTRILDAAAPVFAEHGFTGASTRMIAARAGVNIATLAYHFGDKEGLYVSVIDRIYEQLLAVDLELAHLPADRAERVRVVVASLWRIAAAHKVEVRILLRHVLDTQHLPAHVVSKWMPAALMRLGEALAALDLAPGTDALVFLSVNHLIARYAVTDPADFALFGADPDRIERHLGDVACRMLGM